MFFDCTQDGCGKVFNCKKALKEHERTHNQDRPFKCDLCDQTFTQYSSLQKHARVHDKKKPFKCTNNGCNQAFSQVSNLIRHQRIHTGEKPYECEICGKQFASGSNLKQHVQIHDRQDSRNQYKCIFQGCDKSYLYPSSLKKHYTVSHKEEYEKYLDDQQIETCGFHLKAQEPFSHNLKLNNPSDQTLESNQDIQTGPNNEEGLQSSNTLRSSQRQRAHQRIGYGKPTGVDQMHKHEDSSQLSINQGSTLLPTKRGYQYKVEDLNQVRMRPEEQISKALEGANALKRFKTSAEILSMGQGMPYQGSQLSNLNPSALADLNNQKLNEDLQKSLYLTCHMYFINNQNNHNSGQPLDPQLQQSLAALKNHQAGLGDLQKGKIGLDQGIESAPNILNSQDQKAGTSSLTSHKDPMLAMNNITNQQKAFASMQDPLVSDNNFLNIDPSIRLQNKQYQNSLVQQVQSILEHQNQTFNRNMENQNFMGDSFSFQPQPSLSQASNAHQQVTLPLHLPRPLMQSSQGHQINSPAGLAFQVHAPNPNFTNNRFERISNNSQNIMSPSVYIGKPQAGNNHGSNNSNQSVIRSSQFKYRAKALNDIRKPTPVREGGGSFNLQPCGIISNEGNQQDTVVQVGNGGSGGTTSNRRSSQFYQATNENDSKNESGEKEVEYEENDEEDLEDGLAMKKMNVEENLLQANLNQEIEDINRQVPQLYHSLSSGAKPSAFSQVRKPNPMALLGSSVASNPAGAASNISIKRSSSENSMNMSSNNLDPHPLNIQDIRKSYFFNQNGILSENMESKDQSFDKSGFSSKNIDQVIAQTLSNLRNTNMQASQQPSENENGEK